MSIKPVWYDEACVLCGGCAAVCPVGAVLIHPDKILITEKCTGCGTCIDICPVKSLRRNGK